MKEETIFIPVVDIANKANCILASVSRDVHPEELDIDSIIDMVTDLRASLTGLSHGYEVSHELKKMIIGESNDANTDNNKINVLSQAWKMIRDYDDEIKFLKEKIEEQQHLIDCLKRSRNEAGG